MRRRLDLLRGDDGRPLAVVANVVTILTRDRRWVGVLASYGGAPAKMLVPPWHPDCAEDPDEADGLWTRDDDTRLAIWIEREIGITCDVDMIRRAVRVVGQRIALHHVPDPYAPDTRAPRRTRPRRSHDRRR